MQKKSLGFLLGFFFGILGLLGLLACAEQADKDEFMSGWWKAFIINIVIAVVIAVILVSLIMCVSAQVLR